MRRGRSGKWVGGEEEEWASVSRYCQQVSTPRVSAIGPSSIRGAMIYGEGGCLPQALSGCGCLWVEGSW